MSNVVIFILGVLTGWFAEWLFFTFFVKNKDAKAAVAPVQEKPVAAAPAARQATVTKSQPASGAGKVMPALSSSGTTTKTAAPAAKAEEKVPAEKKVEAPKQEKKKVDKLSASEKPGKTSAAVSDKTETAAAKTGNKADTVDTDKATKPASKKKATTQTKANKGKEKAETETGEDDLSLLKGVGPKMATSLSALGIKRFAQLAALSSDELTRKLDEAGVKVTNKKALLHLPAQAELAAKGDRDALEKLKKEI